MAKRATVHRRRLRGKKNKTGKRRIRGGGDFTGTNCKSYPVLDISTVDSEDFKRTYFSRVYESAELNVQLIEPLENCGRGSYNIVCKISCINNSTQGIYAYRRQIAPLPSDAEEREVIIDNAYNELSVNMVYHKLGIAPHVYMAGIVKDQSHDYMFQVMEYIVPFNTAIRQIKQHSSNSDETVLDFYRKALDMYMVAGEFHFAYDVKGQNLGVRGLNSSEPEVLLLDTDTEFMIHSGIMKIVIKYAMEKMNVSFIDGDIFPNKGVIEEGPETEDPLKPHYSKIIGMLMQYLFASITLMQLLPSPIPRSHINISRQMVPPAIPNTRYAQPSDNVFTDKSVSIFLLNTISFSNSPANNVNQKFMWFLSELLMHPKLIVHPLYLQQYEIHRHNIEMYGKTLKHYIFRNEDDKQIAQWIKIIPPSYLQRDLHALARK